MAPCSTPPASSSSAPSRCPTSPSPAIASAPRHARPVTPPPTPRWRAGPHARARESLPEQSREDRRCLACHAPDAADGIAGVSCEACHGPGALYAASYVMRDPELSRALGLVDPGEKTCAACHTESTPSLERFDVKRKLPLIQHWVDERKGR